MSPNQTATQTVILAAGQGKRMHSALPKVLHSLAGKPMLERVIDVARQISSGAKPIVVYGHQGDVIKANLAHCQVEWVEQTEQLGTGHALLQALPHLNSKQVLVLYGDVPLVSQETLKQMIDTTPAKAIGVLTAVLDQPAGYGRIKRNAKRQVTGIVEEKDATAKEKQIKEINTGIYLIPLDKLKKWLPKIKNKNAQSEYYLTDIITMAVKEKVKVHTVHPVSNDDIAGINDRVQLACAERIYQQRQATSLMLRGVTLADPARFDLRGELTTGRDVFIDVNVVIEGRVVLGDGCVIGPNVVIRNSQLGSQIEVKANSIIDGAEIAADSIIGPFARLRPGTVLATNAHIGNFVEVKNSHIGEGSKVNHLSYVGDSEVGNRVNVGAGTITCNYDGLNKHKTVIGHYAFIGSGTQLVAPVTVGEHATIGAGSTITQDAPAHQLTLARSQQQTIENWKRPQKQKE